MTMYDHNSKKDRVELGRKLAMIVGFTWVCFAFGTWLAIWLCWGVRNGNEASRDLYSIYAGFFGIIPAFILTVLRSDRDMQKQAAQVQQQATKRQATTVVAKTAHMQPARRAGFNGLTLGMSTGFIHGVGFDPHGRLWRTVFHPLLGWVWMGLGYGLLWQARVQGAA